MLMENPEHFLKPGFMSFDRFKTRFHVGRIRIWQHAMAGHP